MNSRTIIHVDMNAYFASIEQKSNPFLRGKPIVVVADSRRRSVVMTSSYEARVFGVKTGMNLYEARQLCPHVVAVDGNSDKYLDSTRKIIDILESFTDQFEMFSCDEAFLDVTGSLNYFKTDGQGIGELIHQKVMEDMELPCSVGVAPNKLLAKLASERKKPNGITVIRSQQVQEFLVDTPVEELCGIGAHLKLKLNQLGVSTCKQLGEMDVQFLRHHFGFWGHWLKRMGQGKDDSPVKKHTEEELVKSVGHSMTFPHDTEELELIQSYLLLLCEKVAARIRKGGFQGKTISLYIRYTDFTGFSRQKTMSEECDDGYEIYKTALGILELTKPFAQAIRLLGVSVSSLIFNPWQEYLFEAMKNRRMINQMIDHLNKKFGAFTLKPASLIYAEKEGILAAPIPPSLRSRW